MRKAWSLAEFVESALDSREHGRVPETARLYLPESVATLIAKTDCRMSNESQGQSTTDAGVEKFVIPPVVGEAITSLLTGNTYVMGEKIGEGHFGFVYACSDVWQNSLAAKVLKATGSYEDVKSRAEAEVGKLREVRNPFITFIHDAFEYPDTFYLITERCHFQITSLLTMDGLDGIVWVRPIARCVLQAAHYIHLHGLVHQDIHPGNVFAALVSDELVPSDHQAMQFKVADLGIAKLFAELHGFNTRAEWMLPPEVLNTLEFGPIDHRLDVYHIGLLLLQVAFSREIQFTRDEILRGRPREMALSLPPPLNSALEKALRRHVPYRTANAMEFWRDLNAPPELPEPALITTP